MYLATYLLRAKITAAPPQQTAVANVRLNRVIHISRSAGCRRERDWSLCHRRLYCRLLWPMMLGPCALSVRLSSGPTLATGPAVAPDAAYPDARWCAARFRVLDATYDPAIGAVDLPRARGGGGSADGRPLVAAAAPGVRRGMEHRPVRKPDLG